MFGVFAVLVAAGLSVTMIVLVNLNAIHSSGQRATHSYEVLDALHELNAAISTERGAFFPQRNAPFTGTLDLYRGARARVDRDVERLEKLSRDSVEQQRQLSEFRLDLDGWRADLAARLRLPSGGEADAETALTDHYAAAMARVATFEAVESALLQQRAEAAERAFAIARAALVAAAVAGVLIGGGCWWSAATVLIRARRSAEAASLAKSQFLANMSHEIRTPLNGVLGMAQVMARDELSAAQRQRLILLQDSGEQLMALLGDVLDFARIEAGRLDLRTDPFDIASLAQSVATSFRAAAHAKGLGLTVTVAQDTPPIWLGDSSRIKQILGNLVGNAVKFTDAGGVRLEVAASDDGVLSLKVVDTGPGIDPAAAASVFEVFRQANNSSTRDHDGAGLGLNIARDLARHMGGDLVLSSVPGQGATFEATLPLQQAEAIEAPAQAEESKAPDLVLSVLVAEDNPTNQQVMAAILGALGVEAVIVDNGRAAVEAWEHQDFDLLLMDLQMPEMDGLDATRAIRRIELATRAAATPIIALSANAMTHHVEECLAAGMDGHLAKPIQVAELVKVLRAAADRRLASGGEGTAASGEIPSRSSASG